MANLAIDSLIVDFIRISYIWDADEIARLRVFDLIRSTWPQFASFHD